MTVMLDEIHRNIGIDWVQHRVRGADLDEVTYADDTTCISTDTRTMNKFIKEIDLVGAKYGLKLNKDKCEVMYTMNNANVHFEDGTQITAKIK